MGVCSPEAFIVRFVRVRCPTFSAPPNGVLRRIGIHGCGRALYRSPVITHTRTVSARLIRHVLQNGRNHLWDITSFAASGKRGKMERYAENAMPLHNTAGWRRQGSGRFYPTLRRGQRSDDPVCSLGTPNVLYTVWAFLLRICRGVMWGGIIVEGSTDAAKPLLEG
ncbi:hypothetical protein TcG_13368 [Trypanosoma cruzi]|nr:hypothetical protein TcG_13368 [Trypanosoma cruzi]